MRQKGIFRYKEFEIQQLHAAQKVGTDSDLLGALALGGNRILDVGAGTGVLSLMMAQRYPQAQVTAVEIDDNAMIDLEHNIAASPFHHRIQVVHQDFTLFYRQSQPELFDAVLCNPPYFDLSLECPDHSRTRARHSSSLPFTHLISGAYHLLRPDGYFSVCIPPEVETKFDSLCRLQGFSPYAIHRVKSVPEKAPKRLVITYCKGYVSSFTEHVGCMRDADRKVSLWYRQLTRDFLL